jgi:hypothetical protein
VAPTELYAQRVGTDFIRTPSQPDICAFGGEIRIVFGEADPPSANCRAAKIWKNVLYFCRQGMRKNDFSQA